MRRVIASSCILIGAAMPDAFAQDEAKFPFEMIAEAVNVVFGAGDFEKTRAFYGDLLGLERIPDLDIPGSGPMLRFLAGKSELKFIVSAGPLPKQAGGRETARGIRMLTIYLDERDATLKRLRDAGVDVANFTGADGEEYMNGFVRDPDDNEINLVFLPPQTPRAKNRKLVIHLTVADDEATQKFYTKLVGLEEITPGMDGQSRPKFQFQAGPTTIRVSTENKDLPATPSLHSDSLGMHYIQYVVRDVAAVREKLIKAGATITREPFALGELATIMFVADPDGIINEFAGPQMKD
ncbi:MAG: VOC family protein [Candidatus Hydrogenedentota bacterium]